MLGLSIVGKESRVRIGFSFGVVRVVEEVEILPANSLLDLHLLLRKHGYISTKVSCDGRFELINNCASVTLCAVVSDSFLNNGSSE